MEAMSPVVQVTNIAPQATRDMMHSLFSTLGVDIVELRLYPTIRDATVSVQSRCAFIKFSDPTHVAVAQHLNNTVFIDRAIIITPIQDHEIPDETLGLQLAAAAPQAGANTNGKLSAKMPPDVVNRIEGLAPNAMIVTYDPKLEVAGLPQYPPLPASTQSDDVEEIRRTVCLVGLDSTVSAQQCMEVLAQAGEVKYFRYCTREQDPIKYALVEFTDQSSVIPAMKMNDLLLGTSRIKVTHALQSITKPQAKSNEAAQREIEEAMSKVKEAQSLVSAAVDPLMGIFGATTSARATRSRSRSKSRRSRSRGRSSYRRSRSRDRRRRSRSRSRRRSRSRDRRRRRSRSRDHHRRRRSRSRSRKRSRRSRSRDRRREEKEAAAETEKNGDKAESVANGDTSSNGKENERRRSRSRSRDRKDKKRSHRSRSREKRRRSRERSKRHRSRSSDRRKRSRSKDKDSSKVSRDYDQEEAGFEASGKTGAPSTPPEPPPKKLDENLQAEDMEISNSP